MPMQRIIYINPQSMRNLAIYDYSLLSNIDADIHYIGSTYYDYKPLPSHVHFHRYFSYNSLTHNWSKALSYILSYLRVLVLVLRLKPATIHIQWLRFPSFDVRFLGLVKRLAHCNLVFTAHNVLPHDTGERHKKNYLRWYQLLDHIIVHAKVTKEEFLSQFPEIPGQKIAVISHGILEMEIDQKALAEKAPEFEHHYQLEGQMVFSSLGYQYYYKGVDLLAEVWATTPTLRDSKNCKLLFVGKNKGVDFSVVEGIDNVMVEDRLVSNEEFHYLLSNTDVYVLPYRDISQSGVLLTAISEEIPVLVTNVGGLTEPFEVASIGWILPTADKELLREVLLHLAENPEEAQRIKKNQKNWSKVQEYYSWNRIGKLTQQLY